MLPAAVEVQHSGSEGGLELTFFDAAGIPTSDPTRVEIIDIDLRGESLSRVRKKSGQLPDVLQDSVAIRVTLRG